MNLEEDQPPPPLPPHQPQPLRFSTCPHHPDESFTGVCPSCLCERLAGLDISTRPKPTTSTASAALKAIFRSSIDNKNNNNNKPSTSASASASSSYLPELRRCKSFSGGKGEGFSGVFEPQRRSCDVRGRSSLWNLFSQDDEGKLVKKTEVWGEIEVETRELGFSGVQEPVEEEEEGEEEEEEELEVEEEEIRVSNVNVEEREEEIVELEHSQEQEPQPEPEKTMKDHIEVDLQPKKPPRDLKEIAGSFWTAASVFSKKLQKWRSKQKRKKRGGGMGGVGDAASTTMQVEKPYSEIGDYGFGRRSCDIAPRYSLDAVRMSFDDPRYSWDEPRASWDGYMIGRMFPRVPPMVSVVEHVGRVDDQIPVEEPTLNEGDTTPGGTAQTRDYYSDSSTSQRRRKSFDRSNSCRKKAAAVVAELDEANSVSNAKVTPATNELFHGTNVLVTDRNLRNSHSNSNSLREDCSESIESVFRDTTSVNSGKGLKKTRRWTKAWSIWGLISKRGGSKEDSRGNVVQRSFSESWPELRNEPNGEAKGGINRVSRSNSSVSSRNSFNMGGSLGGIRKCNAETNGHGKKKREECVLERNRSARFSPNNLDNGLLRFYLTPMRSSRRNGSVKGRPRTSHSIASSILRLY